MDIAHHTPANKRKQIETAEIILYRKLTREQWDNYADARNAIYASASETALDEILEIIRAYLEG